MTGRTAEQLAEIAWADPDNPWGWYELAKALGYDPAVADPRGEFERLAGGHPAAAEGWLEYVASEHYAEAMRMRRASA